MSLPLPLSCSSTRPAPNEEGSPKDWREENDTAWRVMMMQPQAVSARGAIMILASKFKIRQTRGGEMWMWVFPKCLHCLSWCFSVPACLPLSRSYIPKAQRCNSSNSLYSSNVLVVVVVVVVVVVGWFFRSSLLCPLAPCSKQASKQARTCRKHTTRKQGMNECRLSSVQNNRSIKKQET